MCGPIADGLREALDRALSREARAPSTELEAWKPDADLHGKMGESSPRERELIGADTSVATGAPRDAGLVAARQ